jgi:hypothetical protein
LWDKPDKLDGGAFGSTMTHPQPLDLIAPLKPIPDDRKSKGQRPALWLVLLGIWGGDRGDRPLADFSQPHGPGLCKL